MDFFAKLRDFAVHCGLHDRISSSDGVLVAFSGGADSSLLLHYLVSAYGCEKIAACHINHMIRGGEADRDEDFCREVCEKYGISFFSKKINVPEIAERESMGTEEAARRERYAFLTECAGGRLIATAHNATDNLETVIFNLCRGTGLKGIGGIAPERDNIIRPLLCLTGEEVREACESLGISYVTDSTNLTCDYTRNFIRHEIVPKLRQLNPSADDAVLRCARIARDSAEYIETEGQKLISKDNTISRASLVMCPKTVAVAAIRNLYKAALGTADSLGEIHLEDAYSFAIGDKVGTLSMPHKIKFVCERDKIYFGEPPRKELTEASLELPIDGKIYPFGEYFALCATNEGEMPSYSENIYNLFIKHSLPFGTINGSIFVRSRKAGDTILCNNIHKKLKKLMCDKKVPEAIRDSLPVLCDGDGIFLVPGVAARCKSTGNDINIYVFRRKGI